MPHHFRLDVEAYLDPCQPFEFEVDAQYQHLDELPQSAAKRIDIFTSFYLGVEATTDGHWMPPEEFDMLVISSDAFNKFNKQLLTGCKHVTNFSLQVSASPHGQYTNSQHGDPNLIFESLVQVVEVLPKLLRYSVRVGMDGTWARRQSTEEPWHSTKIVRFMREHMPDEPVGEWAGLYHDLNVVSRGQAVYW